MMEDKMIASPFYVSMAIQRLMFTKTYLANVKSKSEFMEAKANSDEIITTVVSYVFSVEDLMYYNEPVL